MKNRKIMACFVLILVVIFSSCNSTSANSSLHTVLELALTEDYNTSDPFIHEKLFCASENIDTLELDISLNMEGESGIVEIADNITKEVL